MQEIWKFVPNCGEKYLVSNFGRYIILRVSRTPRIPKINKKNGYAHISVTYADGRYVRHRAHRLIASLFLDNYSEELEVNHIDGSKINNRIDNLEMCTRQENMEHAWRTGLIDLNKRVCKFGYSRGLLDRETVLKLREDYKHFQGSIAEFARVNSIAYQNCYCLIKNKVYKT